MTEGRRGRGLACRISSHPITRHSIKVNPSVQECTPTLHCVCVKRRWLFLTNAGLDYCLQLDSITSWLTWRGRVNERVRVVASTVSGAMVSLYIRHKKRVRARYGACPQSPHLFSTYPHTYPCDWMRGRKGREEWRGGTGDEMML